MLDFSLGNAAPLTILYDCCFSLFRVMSGVALAVTVGVAAGLLRSQLPPWIKGNPVVIFVLEAPRFPPPIAWIPFVILSVGIGELAAVTIVFIGAFPPIFTNAFDGAEAVPRRISRTARSMEFRGVSYLLRILLPAAMPQIFTGLRIAMGMGWMSVIAAEMISGQSGLGYAIQIHRYNLQYDLMVLDMVLIGTIGFLLSQMTSMLERKMIPWRSDTSLVRSEP